MDISTLSPYIRVASDDTINAPFYLDRVIFDYEFLYVKEGRVSIDVNGRIYEGESGDLFLLKPGEKHTISINENYFRQYAVHYDLYQLQDSAEIPVSFKKAEDMSTKEIKWIRPDVYSEPSLQIPDRIRLPHPQSAEKLFVEIIQEFKGKSLYSPISLKGLFLQLLSCILREIRAPEKNNLTDHQEQLKQIKEFIEQNYSQPLTVAQLAKQAKLSKFYFEKLFKMEWGVSPIKYQQWVRIKQAKERLQFTTQTVQEIALSIGYESLQAFSRAFSKIEGMPPAHYRKRLRNQSLGIK